MISKATFLALGINTEGQKEFLGMWLDENECEKFWLSVLTELKKGILIAYMDSLKDFPDAINSEISKSCRAHWENLSTLFSYPSDIRKASYTELQTGSRTFFASPQWGLLWEVN